MNQHSDVVIVGGGVVGCSLAYALSSRGVKSLIIERDEIAGHASGAAAGLLTPSAEISEPGPVFDFAQEALRMHRTLAGQLKAQTGTDVLYAKQPVLRLAFVEDEEAAMRGQLAWQKDLRWIPGPEVAKIEPCATAMALGAVYSQQEARINSRLLTTALAEAAVRGGAAIQKGRVVGAKKSGDRLTGLVLDNRQIVSGETFVFAMGSWEPDAEKWLHLPLPIGPLRGQILVMKSSQALRHAVFYGGNYVLPQSDGTFLAGTTQELAGYDSRVTPEGQASILRTLKTLAPALTGAEVVGSRASLRPLSRDGRPIVGQAPGWQNVYVSGGCGRKGILLGPLLGECLAALLLKERVPYSLEPFNPQRLLPVKALSS
jgi:glycine oxidase